MVKKMNEFNTLTNILKGYKNILIMAHKNIDLDAFASMAGLSLIIKKFESHI